jgi:hypothetical protein
MTLECINPADLPAPLTCTHVVVATGTRLVTIAGQVAETRRATSWVPATCRSR